MSFEVRTVVYVCVFPPLWTGVGLEGRPDAFVYRAPPPERHPLFLGRGLLGGGSQWTVPYHVWLDRPPPLSQPHEFLRPALVYLLLLLNLTCCFLLRYVFEKTATAV